MGDDGSSTSGGEVTIRFAPYIESRHIGALDTTTAVRNRVIGNSPFSTYEGLSADDAYLGLGFMVSSFPSLYKTFGTNMAGLDIDELLSKGFAEKFAKAEADGIVETELSLIEDAVEKNKEAQLKARDLNSTAGSTFIMAKASIERDRIARTTDLRITVKYSLIPGIVETWTNTLNWDKTLVTKYAESMRDYFLSRINADTFGYEMKKNDALWPITVLDFERNMLAAMTGSAASRTMTKRERSKVSKALLVASWTATGAQLGSNFGPYGTVIGAVIGFVVGLAIMLLE